MKGHERSHALLEALHREHGDWPLPDDMLELVAQLIAVERTMRARRKWWQFW